MRPSLLFLLALELACAAKLNSALVKALTKSRPVIVHLVHSSPTKLEEYAIDDVSEACRKSGATAVLVAPALAQPIIKEQESMRGNFPGPVPVIVDSDLKDLAESATELCEGAKNLGASAIGIRYYPADYAETSALQEALTSVVAAADDVGIASFMLGEFGADNAEGVDGAAEMASKVGAVAALTKRGEDGSAPALGCWNGSPGDLERLRDAGFEGVLLKNACRGDMALGAHIKLPSLAAQMITKAVKNARTKSNKSVWGGAGGLNAAGDGGDPQLAADAYYNQRGLS